MPTNEEIRSHMLTLLAQEPGGTTRALARTLGICETTASYHLRLLAARGAILATLVGRERCWYLRPCGLCPVLRRAIPLLRRDGVARVAEAMDDAPATMPLVAARAGVPVGSARWCVDALAGAHLVERTAGRRAMLRTDAATCLAKARSRESCERWGECAVSLAWREARERGLDAPSVK